MAISLKMDSKNAAPTMAKYPCLYLDDKKVMKGMVVGQKGKATIEYMVSGSGLEIHSIEFAGMKKDTKKEESHE